MYCIVVGCKTQSSNGKGFIVLPKNFDRAKEWLIAAGLEKMVENLSNILSTKHRLRIKFCRKHFLPTSFLNQKISDDAVPRLHLPDSKHSSQHGVLCNKCTTLISDVRYKCITCEDFDLCRSCESQTDHEHNMLRISKPISSIAADDLIKRMSEEFRGSSKSGSISRLNLEPTTILSIDPEYKDSSDDEPVTKYMSSTVEINLSENEKNKICDEVDRVLSVINKSYQQSRTGNRYDCKKGAKTITISTQTVEEEFYPEVEFADVNDSDFQGDIKNEDVLDMAPECVPEPIEEGKLYNLLTS